MGKKKLFPAADTDDGQRLSEHRQDRKLRRSFERRSGDDRRQTYSIDYFESGGVERRKAAQDRRRLEYERRDDWIRVSQWSSVYVDAE